MAFFVFIVGGEAYEGVCLLIMTFCMLLSSFFLSSKNILTSRKYKNHKNVVIIFLRRIEFMENKDTPYSNELLLNRVLTFVEKKEISDSDLAIAFGIEPNGIYKVKHGINSLTIDKLWKMAMMYGTNMNYIFYGPELFENLTVEPEDFNSKYIMPITYLILFREKVSELPEEEKKECLKEAMHILIDNL